MAHLMFMCVYLGEISQPLQTEPPTSDNEDTDSIPGGGGDGEEGSGTSPGVVAAVVIVVLVVVTLLVAAVVVGLILYTRQKRDKDNGKPGHTSHDAFTIGTYV